MNHDKRDEALMVQHKDVPVSGISLTKEGESGKYTVVKAEIGGTWIEVIRVLSDTQFSHIVEPSGMMGAYYNSGPIV